MIADQPDAADAMRERLQADLRSAMKTRAAAEVAILRVLIAAIDNAGAVALAPRSEPRQGEVERRRLGAGAVHAILRREYETLQAAAAEFARLGRGAESERAHGEMAVVGRYLS